jgi:hypothetical protein
VRTYALRLADQGSDRLFLGGADDVALSQSSKMSIDH